jgi:sugar transferase (PEP-CTERM/EpsH1 system associated)
VLGLYALFLILAFNNSGLRIAFIVSRYPWPLEKGDKLRAFNFIRNLSQHHEIYLFSLSNNDLDDTMVKALQPYCKNVIVYRIHQIRMIFGAVKAFFRGLPLQIGYFYFNFIAKEIKDRITALAPDMVFCQLVRTAEYAKGLPIIKVIDFQDSFSMNMERLSEKTSWFRRPLIKREARTLHKYEQKILSTFQFHTIIAEPDRMFFPSPDNEKIAIVPNGVDFEFLNDYDQREQKKHDLLFLGNMSYAPNIDSAVFLVSHIMPEIWKVRPDTSLLIAGAYPTERVKKLQQARVTVSGWIPDIRTAYHTSRVFIAPMRIGSGLQNKLLEAMASKLPAITTTLSNSSRNAEHNKEILIADTHKDIAAAAIKLLENQEYALRMAERGCAMVKERYNWSAIISSLEHKLLNVIDYENS